MADSRDGALHLLLSLLPLKDALELSALSRQLRFSTLRTLTRLGITLTGTEYASQVDFLCSFSCLSTVSLKNEVSRPHIEITVTELARIGALSTLQQLHIHHCNLQSLAPLTQLSNLLTLNLIKCAITLRTTGGGAAAAPSLPALENALAPLSHLTKLQHLALHACFPVTDSSLLVVSELPVLRSLDISKCTNITSSGLICLSRLLSLRQLRLEGCNKITRTCLANLAQLTSLEQLTLENTQMTGGSEQLSSLQALRHLDLGTCYAWERVLPHLTNLQLLQHLRIIDVEARDLRYLLALPDLQCLQLLGTRLGDEDLPLLAGLPGLQQLELHGNNSEEGLAVLAAATRLAHLDLRGNRDLTDDGLAHLPPGLTGLVLDGCDSLTGRGLVHLSQLQYLNLEGCEMQGGAMAHLACLTSLHTLEMYMNVEGISSLAALTRLTTLYLRDYFDVGPSGYSGLQHLSSIHSLHSLTLHGCDGLGELAGLSRVSRLTQLTLSTAGSVCVDGVALVAGLPHLHKLCLTRCTLLIAPVVLLTALTNLQRLELVECIMDLAAVCQALPQLDTLQLMQVEPDASAWCHLTCLTRLRCLTFFGVATLDDDGMAHVAQLSSLEKLSVNACYSISETGLIHLAALPLLRRLDVAYCFDDFRTSWTQHLSTLKFVRGIDSTGFNGYLRVGELQQGESIDVEGESDIGE